MSRFLSYMASREAALVNPAISVMLLSAPPDRALYESNDRATITSETFSLQVLHFVEANQQRRQLDGTSSYH
jgi:hypothetical protein